MRKLENTAKLKSTRRSLSRMLTVEAEMLDQAKEESSK